MAQAFSTVSVVVTSLTTVACIYYDIRAFLAYRTLSVYRRESMRQEMYLFGRNFELCRTYRLRKFSVCCVANCRADADDYDHGAAGDRVLHQEHVAFNDRPELLHCRQRRVHL